LAFALGFFFSFRIILVLFAVRVLGADPRTGAAINLGAGFGLLLLVCFQSLGFPRRTFVSMLRPPALRWVFAFLALSGCSLLWSESASLTTSFAYWCGMVADVAAVVLLLRSGSIPEVSAAILRGFVISTCCLALIAWIMPTDPTDLRLGDEEFFNTNQIGNACALAILLAQCLTRCKQGRWGWAVLFLAVTVLRSLSKATLVAFLVSETFLLIRDTSITRKTGLRAAAAALAVVLAFWGLFEAYYDIYTTTGNQAETLTGRTAIWAYVADGVIERPWIGHGFDSMWKVIPAFGPDRFEARHAENEWLQQLYTYGAAGVVLLAGIYGSLFLQMRGLARSPLRTILFSILIYVAVRGIAEAEPFDLLLPLWSIVLLSSLIGHARAEQELPLPAAAIPGIRKLDALRPAINSAGNLFRA
jgi:hypothetical protein